MYNWTSENKDHKRCDFTYANVCEKCMNSTVYYANTYNMHKKVLLSHTRESDRSMVATGKIVMLTCTSAFYKIRCSFGSNQFLPNSTLLNKFFADIVNNKWSGWSYVCSVKISDRYVRFPGTSSDFKQTMTAGTLWEHGYNHFAKA